MPIRLLLFFAFTLECQGAGHSLERIAHAGGGFGRFDGTNSIDALNANAKKYHWFEIDFVFTADGKLVCIHDWAGAFRRTFQTQYNLIPTEKEFEARVAGNKSYKNCTLKTLIGWLRQNPDKKIVTDVKDDNLRALKTIAQDYPDDRTRFIPQIYHPDQYKPVKSMGYNRIIFTLYRFRGSDKEIFDSLRSLDLYAVTMPAKRVPGGLAIEIKQKGVPTYAHTINTKEELRRLKSMGIDEIYTDWLPASENP